MAYGRMIYLWITAFLVLGCSGSRDCSERFPCPTGAVHSTHPNLWQRPPEVCMKGEAEDLAGLPHEAREPDQYTYANRLSFVPPLALILTWFGILPRWLPATLRTFSANQRLVDVHFISDIPRIKWPQRMPANCYLHEMTLTQYEVLIHLKTKRRLNVTRARKLCDYKPLYGHLHEELLRPYLFWGYGDLDVLWGDLSQVITPESLSHYDVLLPSHAGAIGHLSFFRNNEHMRHLYMQVPNVWEQLASSRMVTFSESRRMHGHRNAAPGFADILYQAEGMRLMRGETVLADCRPHPSRVWTRNKPLDVVRAHWRGEIHCLNCTLTWNGLQLLCWEPTHQVCHELQYYHFLTLKQMIKNSWDPNVLRWSSLRVGPEGQFLSSGHLRGTVRATPLQSL